MPRPGPRRKALTILGAGLGAGVLIDMAGQVVVMSGTKATFSFVPVKAAPGGATATSAAFTASATTGTITSAAPAGAR